jgi:hypothetical protein
MAHDFEELISDGHNYHTWALDIKISLVFYGILPTLRPLAEREAAFLETFKFQAIFIIRNHLHPRLEVRICDGGGAS